ncbi:MAG: NlpC/P60 family protein [Clostridiales bacterium]|nr:NlpC/P60 family protein [Clostridiales bacterium]
MKKSNTLIALLLALSFLTPALTLASCANDEEREESAPSISAPLPEEEDSTQTAPPSVDEQPPQTENTDSSEEEKEEELAPPTQPVLLKSQYINCTGNGVNLRAGAGTSYAVLGQAQTGENYAIVGKTGNWYKIYYKNKPAYLYADYGAVFTIEQNPKQAVEDVILEGYKLLGVPYVYGAVRFHDGKGKLLKGFSTQKFDCSSLMQYIFYKGAEVLLQVNTRTQVKQGEYVAKKDLRRGDCLFFTNESRKHLTGIERVGHVALYLGDNYILHTASDYARIEKISNARWKFYIEARRFL